MNRAEVKKQVDGKKTEKPGQEKKHHLNDSWEPLGVMLCDTVWQVKLRMGKSKKEKKVSKNIFSMDLGY